MDLGEYYSNCVEKCNFCRKSDDISKFITFQKLPCFIGGAHKHNILIVGHSPAVRTGLKPTVTLDLNNDGRLSQYVTKEILDPLGIELNDCVATNIIKCYTKYMPEDIRLNNKKTFMAEVFEYCRFHFEKQVQLLDPKIIISLSETVAILLQNNYSAIEPIPIRMKKIFATVQKLKIFERIYDWIPVVHIPKPKVKKYYFPEQRERLLLLKNMDK